jgi:hypothetical protein
MTVAFPFRTALAVILICATSGSAQISNRISRPSVAFAARPVDAASHASSITLENQLSHIPDAAVVARVPAAGAANSPAGANSEAAAQPRLEYARTNLALDLQAARALAGQSQIQQVIGTQGTVLAFPGIVRQVDESGDQVQLKMIALVGKKLAYDATHNSFVGSIWLGVNEIVGGRPPRQLVTPVDFEILDADNAQPAEVHVTRTGAPYQEVQLQLSAAEGAKVNITSNLAPDPFDLPLPLKPALLVRASDDPIDGLGLGSSVITVTAIGLNNAKGRPVVFQKVGGGSIKPQQGQLDENGMASTELRSDGLNGGAQVIAVLPGLSQVSTNVGFRPPYGAIFASLIGALFGAAIRVGTSKLRGGHAALAILVSVLVGVVVFALFAVGVNVLPIKPTVTQGAAVVFAISALGAFLGASVLPGGSPAPGAAPGEQQVG